MGRYEDRLTQQESGAALSKSSMFLVGYYASVHQLEISNRYIDLHVQLRQKQSVMDAL